MKLPLVSSGKEAGIEDAAKNNKRKAILREITLMQKIRRKILVNQQRDEREWNRICLFRY